MDHRTLDISYCLWLLPLCSTAAFFLSASAHASIFAFYLSDTGFCLPSLSSTISSADCFFFILFFISYLWVLALSSTLFLLCTATLCLLLTDISAFVFYLLSLASVSAFFSSSAVYLCLCWGNWTLAVDYHLCILPSVFYICLLSYTFLSSLNSTLCRLHSAFCPLSFYSATCFFLCHCFCLLPLDSGSVYFLHVRFISLPFACYLLLLTIVSTSYFLPFCHCILPSTSFLCLGFMLILLIESVYKSYQSKFLLFLIIFIIWILQASRTTANRYNSWS